MKTYPRPSDKSSIASQKRLVGIHRNMTLQTKVTAFTIDEPLNIDINKLTVTKRLGMPWTAALKQYRDRTKILSDHQFYLKKTKFITLNANPHFL